MKPSIKLALAVVCGLSILHGGCSEVEITGRQQFNIVPDSMINSMSFQSYGEFLAQHKLSTNAGQTQMVKQRGQSNKGCRRAILPGKLLLGKAARIPMGI